jgi:hypothetical protein
MLHHLGNGKLVQVPGIVIVDRAPNKIPEVAGRACRLYLAIFDFVKLIHGLRRKIGKKPFVNHYPSGYIL